MSLSADDLAELTARGSRYAEAFLKNNKLETIYRFHSLFLYGSAARYHLGLASGYHDFDIEAVFRTLSDNDKRGFVSTHGKPKNLPPLEGKIVQVMRNVYSGSSADAEAAIRELAASKHSKRWKSIKANPVILLYPQTRVLWHSM